jgi:hypothetical protein
LLLLTGCAQLLPLESTRPTLANRRCSSATRSPSGAKDPSSWPLAAVPALPDSDCARDTDCAAFRLADVFLDAAVRRGGRYYEGGDYIVIDTQSGAETYRREAVFSPSGHMFATAAFNEMYETAAEGVRLYTLDFPMRLVRAVSPAC